MVKIKFREVVIFTVSFIILINFVYFRYIYSGYMSKKTHLIEEIHDYDGKIGTAVRKFRSNLNILKKIVIIKKDILFSKKNIELLKSNHTTTFDMSNILKTLLVKSGVSIYGVSLSGITRKSGKNTYSFSVQINDALGKILNFMDLIENYSDNMYISTYSLKPKDGVYSASLIVNFDYVSVR